MKIPIKKYVADPVTLDAINEVLDGRIPYDERELVCDIAKEYRRLADHHEEETKLLIGRIQALELLAKD